MGAGLAPHAVASTWYKSWPGGYLSTCLPPFVTGPWPQECQEPVEPAVAALDVGWPLVRHLPGHERARDGGPLSLDRGSDAEAAGVCLPRPWRALSGPRARQLAGPLTHARHASVVAEAASREIRWSHSAFSLFQPRRLPSTRGAHGGHGTEAFWTADQRVPALRKIWPGLAASCDSSGPGRGGGGGGGL